MKLHKSIFVLEIWHRAKYFFVDQPISDIIPASEPTRLWHSYLDLNPFEQVLD